MGQYLLGSPEGHNNNAEADRSKRVPYVLALRRYEMPGMSGNGFVWPGKPSVSVRPGPLASKQASKPGSSPSLPVTKSQ
jgi:hypothetical protein